EQGGREQLKAEGLALHAVFTISELLWHYHKEGVIGPELYEEIHAYRLAAQ
ncbi:MAG: hypothetical protein UW83_C0025G0008, partial [Parcubacteria group bacterium GW2011_GWD1_44_9]